MVSVVRSGWAVVHSDSATEPCVHRAAAGDERLDLGDAGGGVHVQADRRRVEEPRGDLGGAVAALLSLRGVRLSGSACTRIRESVIYG